MSDVVLIPHGWIGFVGKETGLAVALRKGGEEVLFATKESGPLRWIAVTEFTADPKAILSTEEAMAQDEEGEEPEY